MGHSAENMSKITLLEKENSDLRKQMKKMQDMVFLYKKASKV